MDAVDIAFFAGVIDSRGHIEPARGRITVTTSRVTILKWLAKNTGTKAVIKSREYNKRGCSDHCSEKHQHIAYESFYWTARGLRAYIIARNVFPHAIETQSSLYQLQDLFTKPNDISKTEIGAKMSRLGWAISQDQHGV